jgi:hypothetical protein
VRLTLALAVVAAALVAVVPATIATPSATPIEKKLQKQVATLQAQVKKLQKDTRTTRTEVIFSEATTACLIAHTADALQGTWTVLDQKLGATFGAQAALDDKQLCARLRAPRRQQLPPNNSALLALLKTLIG